ncbi:MAG: hypothetical protein WC250_02290, partial [Candidatus Paceibacterota bacterium]
RLRKLGHSYKEILQLVPVAKSSVSRWLNHLTLTPKELSYLNRMTEERKDGARLKAAFTNRTKRLKREEEIQKIAKREFAKYIKDPLFVAGVLLYWAEGAKQGGYFYFVNSDVEMHKVMLKWVRKYLDLEGFGTGWRLYIHKPYARENCENWWAKSLGVDESKFEKTVYKFTPHKIKKNPTYKGCMRFSIYSRAILVKMFAWQKLLIEYYKQV